MKRRIIYVGLVLIAVAGIIGYNYAYKDHRDIQSEQAVFTGQASQLNALYVDSPQELLNKTVIVHGTVTQLEANGLTLSTSVFCQFDSLRPEYKLGQEITIKGRCIGYDDIFGLINLDQCRQTN